MVEGLCPPNGLELSFPTAQATYLRLYGDSKGKTTSSFRQLGGSRSSRAGFSRHRLLRVVRRAPSRLDEEGLELRNQFTGWNVHEPSVLRSTVIPDPLDPAVLADKNESVPWLPTRHGPLQDTVCVTDFAGGVRKVRAVNTKVFHGSGKLGGRVSRYAHEGQVQLLERRRTFQVRNLLGSRGSTKAHVEVKEHRAISDQ